MTTDKRKPPKSPDKSVNKEKDNGKNETVKNDKFSPGEPDDYNAEEFSTD